ncbi:MAG: hypothetical protein AB7T37_09305 [Dehalococcoidia bacterium]
MALRLQAAARMAAGPMVLAGFFLPWVNGHGVLVGERYSGYDVVRLAGYLQRADLTPGEQVALTLSRIALVGMVAAALWLTALAPRWQASRLHRASGWYIVAAGAAIASSVAWWDGLSTAPGMLLVAGGAAAWVATRLPVPWFRRPSLVTAQPSEL